MNARITSMENLIASDPGGRNVFGLAVPDQLRLAAQSLRLARRVGIVSGFFIPAAGAGETDGPPGAIALGRALQQLGVAVDYLTDCFNAPVFAALSIEPIIEPREFPVMARSDSIRKGGDSEESSQISNLRSEIAQSSSLAADRRSTLGRGGSHRPANAPAEEVTHFVSIERCARGRDGRYRNMRGDDITATTPPLDELFLQAPRRGITTIGIGDGGNEIGMGKVFAAALDCIPHGREIASTVPADFCIAAGVSNWGAYGLVGALSVLAGRDLLPTPDQCIADIEACVRGGAVDGRTHRREPTVDGLPAAATLRMLEEIRRLITPSPLESGRPLRVGIIGYGETGRAAANLLALHGHRIRVSDLNPTAFPSRDREGMVLDASRDHDEGVQDRGRDHSATALGETGGTVCSAEGGRPWSDPSRDREGVDAEPNRDRKGAAAIPPPLPRGDGSAHAEPGGWPDEGSRPIDNRQSTIINHPVVAFERGRHTLEFFSDCDLVIQSPGVRPDSPIVADLHRAGIPLMSELEMASQLCSRPIIAVTGSVGKRTTVELMQRLFAESGQRLDIGGNRGLPLSTILACGSLPTVSVPREVSSGHGETHQCAVDRANGDQPPIALAVSSFQLESIVHFRPQIAIFLNIHEEFVDRHGSLAEYIRIKSRVFMNQHPDDILILPYDDERLRSLVRKHHGRTFFISKSREVERGAWFSNRTLCINVDGTVETTGVGRLPMANNPENLLAAALARRLYQGTV